MFSRRSMIGLTIRIQRDREVLAVLGRVACRGFKACTFARAQLGVFSGEIPEADFIAVAVVEAGA